MLRKLAHLIFAVCCIFGETTAVSDNGHKLLKSLKEYYLFKPIQHSSGTRSTPNNSCSTVLSKGHAKHMPEVTFSFHANETKYEIVLELNDQLISSGFSTAYLGAGKNGEDLIEEHTPKGINNCYYHGYVRGVENSQVVASTCYGLKGTIFLPNDVLQVAPISGHDSMHVLYRAQDSESHSCGTDYFKSFHRTMTVSDALLAPSRLKRATEEKKFIELMFVVDNQDYKKFSSREELNDHVKEVVNHIDGLYKKLQLRVVLLHVEVWATADKITSTSDAQNVLSAFLNYRKDKIQNSPASSPWRYTDNAQLLYGGSFDGSTVGMATVSSMCSLRSGGVNEDRTSNPLSAASTVAHEMGHNMGMSHDTPDCNCDGVKCVMAATAGATAPDAWSTCSVNYLNKGYEHGTANCLLNVPDSDRLFGGPKCGNGIVEQREECDCGLPDECQSKCCNATTCQLHPEAQCADGVCCTADCRFKSSCSTCRPTENDCDIAEYCTGHSAHCPGNIHKLDGMDCRTGDGICYGGICRTHLMQCQEIWGPNAKNGEEQCYKSVNKKGNSNGNCGKEGGRFKACTPENVLCGKILCMEGENYPLVASDRVFYRNTFANYVCKTLQSINETSDTSDPGAVWDGTKCGDGKMCFDGVCTPITDILPSCNMDCHGHGVCNNYRNCHCDAGWAPPDCSRKGNGGSADSGPICADGMELQVILLIVFFAVIFPIILAVIFYIWWRVCGGSVKVYAWRKNRAYRRGQQNPTKVKEARKEKPAYSSRPNVGAPPEKRQFSDFQHENPSGPTRPAPPPNYANQKRPSAPNVLPAARPPPPVRPSPRLPQRNAPPTPVKPPVKPPEVPQKPTPPNVAFRRGPTPSNSNNSNPSSVQARIMQLQRNNNAV